MLPSPISEICNTNREKHAVMVMIIEMMMKMGTTIVARKNIYIIPLHWLYVFVWASITTADLRKIG